MHRQVSIPLNELRVINVRSVAATAEASANATDGRRGARASPPSSSEGYRPLQFHVIYHFEAACSAVGQVVGAGDGSGGTVVCTAADILTTKKIRFMQSSLDRALPYLSSALHSLPTEAIEVTDGVCRGMSNDAVVVTDADFVLMVGAIPTAQSSGMTLAWGRSCARTAVNNRPVVGQINFIPSAVRGITPSALDVSVAVHEVTHALGFASLFQTLASYVGEDGTLHDSGGTFTVFREGLQKDVHLVRTPRILRAARAHFGCDTLDGVEVEDMGGRGTADSHWKKRLFFEEAMVGVITTGRLFYSSVTLAFFEDKGFYRANYEVAEDTYQWGRNRGCSFLYQNCKTLHDAGLKEFCFSKDSRTEQHCTLDRSSIGYCNTVVYQSALPQRYQYFNNPREGGAEATMDYCPARVTYAGTVCTDTATYGTIANLYANEYGSSSRCFSSNVITNAFPTVKSGARCFPCVCSETGQLQLRIQGQSVPCPADGSAGRADTSALLGAHGFVECPAAVEVCDGGDYSGMSTIPAGVTTGTPTVNHSPLLFVLQPPLAAASCAERWAVCQSRSLMTHYPLCEHTVRQVIACMGTDCPSYVKRWLHRHLPDAGKRCRSNAAAQAQECADGWDGAAVMCQALA